MLKLPPIHHPARYVGLYIYDFGSHVVVGYTGEEVRLLRSMEAYRTGTAYEIYRATDEGGFELRGAHDQRLGLREALCLLREDGTMARRDYDAIMRAADARPLPCPAQLMVGRLYAFTPSNVTALTYDAAVSHLVSNWLTQTGCVVGDKVLGGSETYELLQDSEGLRISSCTLPSAFDNADRSIEEVLAAIHKPLQR